MTPRPGRFWLKSRNKGQLPGRAMSPPARSLPASLAASCPDPGVTDTDVMAARLRCLHVRPRYLTAGSDNPRHRPLPSLTAE
jgi:hypothetical protein